MPQPNHAHTAILLTFDRAVASSNRLSGIEGRFDSPCTCLFDTRSADDQATRPNHHNDKPAAISTSKAPAAANKLLISVSLVSTTNRELKP